MTLEEILKHSLVGREIAVYLSYNSANGTGYLVIYNDGYSSNEKFWTKITNVQFEKEEVMCSTYDILIDTKLNIILDVEGIANRTGKGECFIIQYDNFDKLEFRNL